MIPLVLDKLICLCYTLYIMARQLTERQKGAAIFLQDAKRRAGLYADWLDPKRRRDYESNPLLRAMDTVVAAANRALADPRVRAWLEATDGR